MTIDIGMLLADRYRLTRRIAVGGMGAVWAAEDTTLAREVAIKVLKPELTADPEFVGRFRTEARITASLNDPGIAMVHDYGEIASVPGGPRDTAYLVMELVVGEPLSAVLARAGYLSVERTVDLLAQAGTALQAAHSRGLVHRDIKPGNILITPAGHIKITDFGIAKAVYQLPVTRSGLVMGTAQYFSPEQAAGATAVPASDVYALGVVAYECLMGSRPFDDTSPVAIATAQVHRPPPPLAPSIPAPVALLVMVMLSKDPHSRYPDGAHLAAACAAVQSGGLPPLPPGVTSVTAYPGWTLPAGPGTGTPAGTAVFGAPPPTGAPPSVVGTAATTPTALGASRQQIVISRSTTPRRRRHTGLSVLMVLIILLIAAAVGAALVWRPEWVIGL